MEPVWHNPDPEYLRVYAGTCLVFEIYTDTETWVRNVIFNLTSYININIAFIKSTGFVSCLVVTMRSDRQSVDPDDRTADCKTANANTNTLS